MKTVGKQLQEARLARNWTPEMAARETKIQVARVRDLEADDYAHFNNATYARGFVRTYARALGLDEYKILRQLDNRLPDDDSANIVNSDGGVAYLPETALPPRVAHRDFTGLYIVLGLGVVVALISVFVLFRAYQVGEFGHWSSSDTASTEAPTNTAPAVATAPSGEPAARALPVDSNTPPPIPEAAPTNAVASAPPADTNAATAAIPVALPESEAPAVAPPRALPVDPSTLVASAQTSPPATAPPPADIPVNAPRALPVNLADLNNPPPPANFPAATTATPEAPRALPVSPADLAAATPSPTPTPVEPASQTPSNPERPNGPVVLPPPNTPGANGPAPVADDAAQPLVLTASRDSFVRVTALDTAGGDKPVYAAVLHGGQSVGFNGHKFSVTVDNPSAVDIKLDSVNYGPHSDGSEPETFTVVSHVQ
jgi:cytoskeletal protein RodZ